MVAGVQPGAEMIVLFGVVTVTLVGPVQVP